MNESKQMFCFTDRLKIKALQPNTIVYLKKDRKEFNGGMNAVFPDQCHISYQSFV